MIHLINHTAFDAVIFFINWTLEVYNFLQVKQAINIQLITSFSQAKNMQGEMESFLWPGNIYFLYSKMNFPSLPYLNLEVEKCIA